MKSFYSTRWILCWILFVLALLILIAGIFAFSTDWRQGLGLTLIGIGIAGPTAWWLRRANRKTRVHHMKTMACLGVVVVVGGAFILPWKDLGEELLDDEAVRTYEKAPESSVEKSPAATSMNSATATPSTQTTEIKSSSPPPPPFEEDPEPTVTITEVEPMAPPRVTVTEVETLAPPRVTIYSEVPIAPDPPQAVDPDIGETGGEPEPSGDVSPEPTTQTENTSPTPTEIGNSQPQNQTTEGDQAPNDGGAGGNQTGAGELGQNFPEFGGVVPTNPSEPVR